MMIGMADEIETAPPRPARPASSGAPCPDRSGKVLVIGDDTRSFLTIVRSLGRKGLAVHVAPFNWQAPALASRYILERHWLPYYIGDGRDWLETVTRLFTRHRFDLVIPCDERSLLPLVRHRATLEGLCRLALPDTRAIDVFYDKHITREVARSLDVPVAAGHLLGANESARAIAQGLGLPVVLKPRRSYETGSLHTRHQVAVVTTQTALVAALAEISAGTHVVEEFFRGAGAGVSVLCDRGRVCYAFQHRRVHEWGGSGYYRVSMPLEPAMVGAVDRLVATVSYTGLAMFEFKVNTKTGAWILVEVNARPWGSMPLPVSLGLDFPFDWYRLLVDGAAPPPRTYPAGRYARNTVPDANTILADTSGTPGVVPKVIRLVHYALEYRRVLMRIETNDVLVGDDPRPGMAELNRLIQGGLRRGASRLPGASLLRRIRDRAAVRRVARAATGHPLRIAIVCQGNICRSPFAALVLREALSQAPMARSIAISSAGMLPRPPHPSPNTAIAAARRAGIDMSAHRSRHFGPEEADTADLVIIFDQKNEAWLFRRYSDLAAPVVFLGSFWTSALGGPLSITDPDGGDAALFDATYVRIQRAALAFLSVIRRAVRT